MIAPKEGNGLHDWLLTKSRELLVEGNEPEEVVSILTDTIEVRTTQDPETEIRNAVEGADAWLKEHPGYRFGRKRQQRIKLDPTNYHFQDPFKWRDKRSYYLPVDQGLRNRALDAGLIELESYGEFDLGELFARIDFLLCYAKEVYHPQIARLTTVVKIASEQQFIVSTYCLTVKRGKCDDNMGKPLYQVIEFDHDSKENQWKLLMWLDQSAVRLGMIVDSGHKSLHGWFPVFHLGRREVKSFFRLATSIGADRHTWVASQYVRMPNGINRKTGNRQNVVYWNENVIGEHNEIVRKYCCEKKDNSV